MATVILVRHGRSTANVEGILAGRTPGVVLDDTGRAQAERVAERISEVPVVGVVSSPLERCRQTAQAIVEKQREQLTVSVEGGINECDYGEWQSRKLADLAKEALWSVVVGKPSAAVFPGGESLSEMQDRAVAAIRRLDAGVEAEHGPGAVWVAVSHGDIIKSVLADAFGMPFDHFQRIHANPASVSIVHYTATDPHVLSVNTEAGDLSWLRAKEGDAMKGAEVGGGAGPSSPPPSAP